MCSPGSMTARELWDTSRSRRTPPTSRSGPRQNSERKSTQHLKNQ